MDELQKKVAPIAEKYQLRAVYLFGSYARGEATEKSDVDILVDITDSKVKGWVMGGLYEDLCEIFSRKVDVATTGSLTQYEDDLQLRFRESVMKDRVLIYDKQ